MLAFTLALPAMCAQAKWPAGYVPKPEWTFIYGAQYQAQQGPSLSLGLIHGITTDTMSTSGPLLQAEPGLGGGKLSAGWAFVFHSGDSYLPPVGGLGLKMSVLRTWRHPRGVGPGHTYVGPELDLGVLYLKLSAGVKWRATSRSRDGRTLFTWGVGAGF